MMGFEVEFLTGTSVAALPHRREAAEWPPHPDRLFQALVAAWGRNDPPLDDEREALEWLEALDMDGLSVSAPAAHRRSVVAVYVPPNDARTTGKVGDKVPSDLSAAIRVVPEFRKNRQPRSFPAVLPAAEPAVIRYVWRDAPQADRYSEALRRLARQVTYLGHSHTLVRVEFVTVAADSEAVEYGWINENEAPLRVPFKGRLRDLYRRHEQSKSAGRLVRPAPSLVSRRFQAPPRTLQSSTVFDPNNITVMADAGGFDPALEAFPLVAKRLRDALLKSAQDIGLLPSPVLSGHDDDGTPTRRPHIAIVPLADVGWSYSQGRLMGLGLLWPREIADDDRRNALTVLASFLREGHGEVGLLHFGRKGSWTLALEPDPNRASLRFGRYVRPSRRWGTVLPVALDRHLKEHPSDELAAIVVQSCTNIGLPKEAVDGIEIEVHKRAPVKGAPSALEVRKSLPQDSPYRGRPLAHMVLTFGQPIRGPIVLGAGRFRGLGLFLALDDERP